MFDRWLYRPGPWRRWERWALAAGWVYLVAGGVWMLLTSYGVIDAG